MISLLQRQRALYWARSALHAARCIRLHGAFAYHGGDAIACFGYWACLDEASARRREASLPLQLDLFSQGVR